jgi:predicted MFS family arabinose efflux permease
VLGRYGPSWAFLINALSFLAVMVVLALVRPVPAARVPSDRHVLAEFAEGVRYSRRHGGIMVAIGLVVAVFFLGNPVFALAAVFARRVYHVGAGWYGVLTAAYGIGAVLGAVALGVLGRSWPRSRLVVASIWLYAVGLVGFGLSDSLAVGFVFLALAGTAFLGSVATLNTTVQLLVADRVRGRVLALWMMALTGSLPLGALLQGWLMDQIGAPTTIVIAGLLLGAVALLLVLRPALAATLDEHTHRRRWLPEPLPDVQAVGA